MWERLEQTNKRYIEIEELIASPEIATDPNQLQKLAKERADIEDVVTMYREYESTSRSLDETKEMLNDGLEEAKQFVSRLSYFKLGESLGGVKSLICLPASMTHASIPAEDRGKLGLADGLIRLSVDIEDPRDLVDDLRQGLNCVSQEPLQVEPPAAI